MDRKIVFCKKYSADVDKKCFGDCLLLALLGQLSVQLAGFAGILPVGLEGGRDQLRRDGIRYGRLTQRRGKAR